jgi:hypothetical protein
LFANTPIIIYCIVDIYLKFGKTLTTVLWRPPLSRTEAQGAAGISAALDFAGLSPEENNHEIRASAFHHLASGTQCLRP